MKKTLLIVSLCTLALPAFSQTSTQNFTARYGRRAQRATPPTAEPRDEGAIQRAVRKGNPLQLINPFAPKEFGSGQDMVVYQEPQGPAPDPEQRHNPQPRPVGVRLLSFFFW